MKQQIRDTFQRGFILIAAAVFFGGFMQQLGADVESSWVQTNGPYGAEILTLYAAPKGVLFAGTEGAGIFRSTDRGDTWTPTNTGLHFEPGDGFTGVTTLVQKGDTFYAGTRRTLYASTDGGNTWHHVLNFQKYESISGIVVIGERIYVGTLNTGVWYSDDEGESWQQVNEGLKTTLILQLSKTGTTLVAGTSDGAFRKRVNEDSWTPINAGFVAKPIDTKPINKARMDAGLNPLPERGYPSGIRIDSFANMDHLLYVGVYMGGDHGIFRSNDEGDTWARITAEEMTHTVEAVTVYGGTLYASTHGSGVFRSDDKGDSWIVVNDGLTNRTVSALLAVNEDTVFVGTPDGGIFRTMDGGTSWMEVNTGLTNTSVGELAVVGQSIYAGMSERLVYTVDGGKSWQPVKPSSMLGDYLFSPLSVSDGELYIGAIRFAPRDQRGVVGGVFGLDEENNLLDEVIVNRDLTGIACLEIVGTTFYIGTQRDGIFQWEKDSDPWTTNLGLKGRFITALSVNGENIYAGTDNGEIYRSENAGKSWQLVNSTDMADSSISGLEWVGSTLYASAWGKGVIRSVNGGDSWTPINDGLDDREVLTMIAVGTELYAGTYSKGVFQWMPDKRWWEPMGSLHLHQILSLVVLDDFLYAGTRAGGVYKIRIQE